MVSISEVNRWARIKISALVKQNDARLLLNILQRKNHKTNDMMCILLSWLHSTSTGELNFFSVYFAGIISQHYAKIISYHESANVVLGLEKKLFHIKCQHANGLLTKSSFPRKNRWCLQCF